MQAVEAQGGPPRKRLPTQVTHVRLLSRVQDHVLPEVSLQPVALLAVGAGERPLPAMAHLDIESKSNI